IDSATGQSRMLTARRTRSDGGRRGLRWGSPHGTSYGAGWIFPNFLIFFLAKPLSNDYSQTLLYHSRCPCVPDRFGLFPFQDWPSAETAARLAILSQTRVRGLTLPSPVRPV